MKVRPNTFIGLALTPMIVFSSQSVFAFSITPTNLTSLGSNYRPEQGYTIDGEKWVTKLKPLSVLSRGGTAEFNALLQDFKNAGWVFETASNDLQGSFKIERYQAFGVGSGSGAGVGANFRLQYMPQPNDPNTYGSLSGVHWIQRIYNNHSSVTKKHGDIDNAIDVFSRSKSFTEPARLFTDYDNPPPLPYFVDNPSRNDPGNSHTWTAELYLVNFVPSNGTGVICNPKCPPSKTSLAVASAPKGKVIIYNGISWGWENKTVPEPASTLGLLALGTLSMASVLKRRMKRKFTAN
jgi:PEP-CTERM motif